MCQLSYKPELKSNFFPKTTGRTVLQDCDGEIVGRVAGEPEAERLMCIAEHNFLIADTIQFFHPADGQMTVLQHNPLARFYAFFDCVGRNRTL